MKKEKTKLDTERDIWTLTCLFVRLHLNYIPSQKHRNTLSREETKANAASSGAKMKVNRFLMVFIAGC